MNLRNIVAILYFVRVCEGALGMSEVIPSDLARCIHRALGPECTDKSIHFGLKFLYESP